MLFGNWPFGADLHCFQSNKLVSRYLSTADGTREAGEKRWKERQWSKRGQRGGKERMAAWREGEM